MKKGKLMKQIKNKYFWVISLISTWPLTFLAFAVCGYFKLSFRLVLSLGILASVQGMAHWYFMHRWAYPDGTIKEFLYEDTE